MPYNIHTSLGRRSDRQWELRCQIVLYRQLTSTPFLFATVILYLLTEAALIVAPPPLTPHPSYLNSTLDMPHDIHFVIVNGAGIAFLPFNVFYGSQAAQIICTVTEIKMLFVHRLPRYNWFTTVCMQRLIARLISSKC